MTIKQASPSPRAFCLAWHQVNFVEFKFEATLWGISKGFPRCAADCVHLSCFAGLILSRNPLEIDKFHNYETPAHIWFDVTNKLKLPE